MGRKKQGRSNGCRRCRQECGNKGQFSVRNANLRPTHFDSSFSLALSPLLPGKNEGRSRLPLSGVERNGEGGTNERTNEIGSLHIAGK